MFRTVGCCAVVLLCGLPVVALAQEKEDQPAVASDRDWAKFAAVGPEHKQLARLVGQWKVEAKTYYGDAEKPETSEGTATFRRLLGGRFVQQNFQGSFAGKPFRGIGITGYDNAKKKYVGTWIDTMGTGIMTTEGEYDASKHELVETGVSSSPGGDKKVKLVSRYEDEDKFTFTMYMVNKSGEETKFLEMTYTRDKEASKKEE